MLTADDIPTIRNAILKRLGKERGVALCDMPIRVGADAICVGVLATLGDDIVVRSRFDLPLVFDLAHLHNEIDEIAEQYKAARQNYWKGGRIMMLPEQTLPGTGLRGRWSA